MSKFKIRDDTIINIIKDILKKVEGPISYFLLKPTDKMKQMLGHRPPIIILFGDRHTGDNKCIECKEEDGCLSFYGGNPSVSNFFSYLSRIAHVDVFLETWYSKTDRELGKIKGKHKKDYNSALVEFKKFISPCLSLKDKKDCTVKDYYIHMSDPRYHYDPRKIDSIFQIIAKYDLPMFKLQVDELLKDKDGYNPDYREVLILVLEALELGTKEFIKKVFRYNPIIQKFSKIYKQLSKLPEELQDLIYNNYFDTIEEADKPLYKCMKPHKFLMSFDYTKFQYPSDDESIIKYKDDIIGRAELPVEPLYKDLRNKINSYPMIEKQGSFCSLLGVSSGLDLYYLGRTFKKAYDEQKKETVSEISIGYFGAAHVKNIVNFLSKNGLYEIIEDKYNDSKCLRLV